MTAAVELEWVWLPHWLSVEVLDPTVENRPHGHVVALLLVRFDPTIDAVDGVRMPRFVLSQILLVHLNGDICAVWRLPYWS